MSGATAPTASGEVFDQRIAPVLFPYESTNSPDLIFVTGQPGVAALRAVGSLTHAQEIALLSARDLRAFHPDYLRLSRSRSPESDRELTDSATAWMRSALRYSRTTRRSILLEGTSASLDVMLATTGLFASSGFRTSVAIVSSPRAESLLAATSAYLLAARTGRVAPFTTIEAHDAELGALRKIAETVESESGVDHLWIIGRDGSAEFDAERTGPHGYSGAGNALAHAQSAPMSAPQTMRWLSELRAVTDYALSSSRIAQPVAEVLAELHEIGLREILPDLRLPSDSQARPAAEESVSRRLLAIRQSSLARTRPAPQHAPAISIPEPSRGLER